MVTPLPLVVAAALWCLLASERLIQSTALDEEFVCRTDKTSHEVTADYRVWRSAHVRVESSNFTGQCEVKATLATSSERPQTGQPPLLLLIIISEIRLSQGVQLSYSRMRKVVGRVNDAHCIAVPCGPSYLWTSQPPVLYLYVHNSTGASISYEAAFLVTEATNVCGLANRTGELMVQSGDSGEYAFASDHRYKALPPNNVTCTPDKEYLLMLRPPVSSALLNVTVLVCPCSNYTGALTLNGRSCNEGMTVVSEQPGSNVALRYVFSKSCEEKHNKLTGFIVRARVIASTSTPSTSNIVAASIAAGLAAAVASGIAVASLYRHSLRCRQRLPGRKPPSAVHHVPSSASACDEEIPMVGNDLYGVTLAPRTTADGRRAPFTSA